MHYPTSLRHLKAVLRAGDLRGAVIYLNSLTEHRFTSLFRFDGGMLRNAVVLDRENPGQDHCDDLPVLASYCVFVRDRGETFEIGDRATRASATIPSAPRYAATAACPCRTNAGACSARSATSTCSRARSARRTSRRWK